MALLEMHDEIWEVWTSIHYLGAVGYCTDCGPN